MSNRYKYIPSGLDYKSYTMEAQTDNEYIVNYNINNIQYLYNHLTIIEEWISNLPDISDLSGYYTKEEIDDLLLEKVDLDYLTTNYYNEEDVDLLLSNKVDNETLNDYYLKTDIDNIFSSYYTIDEIDLIENDLDNRINLNTTNIENNANNIKTITDTISANFSTFGRYQIVGNEISDTSDEVRFDISEIVALDSSYVNVQLTNNQFSNIVGGKITFNIVADGIINNDTENLTLTLRIYLNDNVVDTENKVIETNKTISINYANVLEVKENDIVYATLQITSGIGILSSLNPVIINIDFNSVNSISAVKSSVVINDYLDLPNNGINPKLNQIDTNTSAIENNSIDITSLLNSIDSINQKIDKINTINTLYSDNTGNNTQITLNNSVEKYKWIEVRMFLSYSTYTDKDIIFNILSEKIVYNRNIIALATGGGDKAEFTFTNANTITLKDANNSTWIRGVYGKELI